MEHICFATNNLHKLEEVRSVLGSDFRVLSLDEITCKEELPETGNTLEANAHQKARYVFDHYKQTCFADDTGLEVEALNNAPGVYSARYAGPQRNSEDNIDLLLKNLTGKENRKARFRTVLCWVSEKDHPRSVSHPQSHPSLPQSVSSQTQPRSVSSQTEIKSRDEWSVATQTMENEMEVHYFEGIVEGEIINVRRGTEGFGYDSVFVPAGYDKTFAEMSMEEKNALSHRSRAVSKLVKFLKDK
jgi:XTP/dITP diphosphohydrolase